MTAPSKLGVGIIGVSPTRGWAATAHIPVLRALPNYEIRALTAQSAEPARAAGELFGVSTVFSDHEQLVTQPDIDVVAVTVKVPHHRELVSAALAAGKAVYCEWPLGRDLDDARAMAALAAEQGVRTVVGLQARQAPAIEFVQELLRDGYVGEVLSTTMVGLSVPGDVVVEPNVYMLNKTNGANLLTIAVGHSLDTLNYLLGEFADLSAVSDLRRPLITIEETGEQMVKTAADQIAVIGTLTSGATASVHVREAVAGGCGFLWEINGTDGTLRITADAAFPEIYPLTVAGAHGRNEPPSLLSLRRWHTNGPRSRACKERPPSTSGVRTPRSRQTWTTGHTLCRTSPTPSGATRSSPPSRGLPRQGSA
jgi:predicted dehydrogenase